MKKSLFFLSLLSMYSLHAEALEYPAPEKEFISYVQDAASEAVTVNNDMKLSVIKRKRDSSICKNLKHKGDFSHWYGKVKMIGATGEGLGKLAIEIENGITLHTWNNAFSDGDYETLIKPDSELFDRVSNLNVGDYVEFTGHPFKGRKACINETSLSLSGGLQEPEFLFAFTDVNKVSM